MSYPAWVYSTRDPPTLVTGPAQVAALPTGFVMDPATLAIPPVALMASAVVTVVAVSKNTAPVSSKTAAPLVIGNVVTIQGSSKH